MNRALRHPRFTPLRALVAGLAATIVVTLTAGGVFLLGTGEGRPVAGENTPNLVPDRTIPSAPPSSAGRGFR